MTDFEQTFHSLGDFLDHAGSMKANTPDFLRGRSYDDASWYGVSKRELLDEEHAGMAVLRLARYGWPKGASLMSDVDTSVDIPRAKNIRRRMAWSDQGDDISMQRVWSGNLERAWQRTTRQLTTGPSRIRIVVDAIASAGLDARQMRWRGVAALKLADTLTGAGYSVQVESAFTGNGGSCRRLEYGKRTLRVIVKSYSDPLDLESLAACTVLPGFFRALGHAWAGGGMSVPTLSLSDIEDKSDSAYTVIIPQSIYSSSDAAAHVNQVLESLNPDQEKHVI